MIRTSRLLLVAGFTVAVVATLIGLLIPGGGLQWFLRTPAGQLGVPLGLALLAAAAIIGRLERAEAATSALRGSTMADRSIAGSEIPSPTVLRDRDAAL